MPPQIDIINNINHQLLTDPKLAGIQKMITDARTDHEEVAILRILAKIEKKKQQQ